MKKRRIAILTYQDLACLFIAGLLFGLSTAWLAEPYMVQLAQALAPRPAGT